MAQEIDYYCLNCGQKLDERDIKKHMEQHRKEDSNKTTGRIKYIRQLQDR